MHASQRCTFGAIEASKPTTSAAWVSWVRSARGRFCCCAGKGWAAVRFQDLRAVAFGIDPTLLDELIDGQSEACPQDIRERSFQSELRCGGESAVCAISNSLRDGRTGNLSYQPVHSSGTKADRVPALESMVVCDSRSYRVIYVEIMVPGVAAATHAEPIFDRASVDLAACPGGESDRASRRFPAGPRRLPATGHRGSPTGFRLWDIQWNGTL